MATKLGKGNFPSGSSPSDYECFGPPAMKDGEFDDVKIVDLGCFKQDGTDSNKFYHGAVVKNRNTGKWYAYFEWGRTGSVHPDYMFVECSSESEAQQEFAKQIHSKNDKRGMWTTIAGIRTLTAKPKKDCYLVRPQATRSTGLPDAKTIKSSDGMTVKKMSVTKSKTKTVKKRKSSNVDPQTASLMRDMNIATVKFAKSAMADSSLPTQVAIDEGRQALQAAQKRLVKVGSSIKAQTEDKDLYDITTLLYSRIPRIKAVGAPKSDWVLSQDNVLRWQQDLDAFESALHTEDMSVVESDDDPFGGMNITMKWLDRRSPEGEFIYSWMPRATRDRHSYIGKMKIANVWTVERHGALPRFKKVMEKVLADKPRISERPICQPTSRTDLSTSDRKLYKAANVGLLFHGTRSVNVTGIMREGLRLPKQLVGVQITGAMFGPGHYWADDWKKSAGYTSMRGSYYSGGSGTVRGRGAFMFAADVVLGKAHVASGPRGYSGPPRGTHCIFGKANVSQVMNNEWITFDVNQNQLCYLVEFNV